MADRYLGPTLAQELRQRGWMAVIEYVPPFQKLASWWLDRPHHFAAVRLRDGVLVRAPTVGELLGLIDSMALEASVGLPFVPTEGAEEHQRRLEALCLTQGGHVPSVRKPGLCSCCGAVLGVRGVARG
jgi:hypothetical protein